MSGRFTDRCEASTYDDEPPAGFFPLGKPDSDDSVSMPERIFLRLVNVGRACQLHRLPLLSADDAITLNAKQLEGLIDELDFVMGITSDPLIQWWSYRVIALARHLLACGGSLTVDPAA